MQKMLFIASFFLCNLQACEELLLRSLVAKNARQERVVEIIAKADCDTIVEIGGGDLPISFFTPIDKKVIVIDPRVKRIKGEKNHNITHLTQSFETWDEKFDSKRFAVIILGIDLKLSDGAWRKLLALIDRSALTIIEYAARNKESRDQFKCIQGSVGGKTWNTPEEIEITGRVSPKYKAQISTHRILQCTLPVENQEAEKAE